MTRAIVLMMDSLGIGSSADASEFGDHGADTLGHIAEACASGRADETGLRSGPLQIPNLCHWGLGAAARLSTGRLPPGLVDRDCRGRYGYAVEQSRGKDTPSGHWEMAGVPVMFDWGYFPREVPCFPADLIETLITENGLPGFLGNRHASGTEIIRELGEEHVATGKPIVYTSADSVFQIAAHEESFGLERLLDLCRNARRHVDALNIGRVIARPFVGDRAETFERTGNRRDFATPPPAETLLDKITQSGRDVFAIGKIADIYAHQGTGEEIKADGNTALFDVTLEAVERADDGSLIFTNFVDFDQLYGHRRNVAGYAAALERFDRRLPELVAKLGHGDIVFVTADHGCDPTWPGTDHTREHVPAIAYGPTLSPANVGRRGSFADIGQSIAGHLGISPLDHGIGFLT